jgi:hypothetical protein
MSKHCTISSGTVIIKMIGFYPKLVMLPNVLYRIGKKSCIDT